MAYSVGDSDYFSTWQIFVSHLRIECSGLLVKDAQVFAGLDGTLLMAPARPVKNSGDVKELLRAISEHAELAADRRCPQA